MNKKRKGGNARLVLLLLILVIAAFYKLSDFATDYLWFSEMGYTAVFFKEIGTKLMLGVPMFVILVVISYIYLSILKRNFLKRAEMDLPDEEANKNIRSMIVIFSCVLGAILTIIAVPALWFQMLQFMHATDFNLADPIFGRDLGFYMFKLELFNGLNSMGLNLVVTLLGLTFLFYVMLVSFARPAVKVQEAREARESDEDFEPFEPEEEMFEDEPAGRFGPFGKHVKNVFRKQSKKVVQKAPEGGQIGRIILTVASAQLTVLGVLLFALVGINAFLSQFDLMYSQTGVVYGAGYTDINVTLMIYRVLMILSAAGAILFAVGLRKRSIKIAIAIPAIMVILSLGGSGIAGVVQSLVVSTDEITKEREYLQNNIEYTRLAYGLENIRVKDFAADNSLSKLDVLKNMETFSNIRINDFEPAERFYNQTQSIRSYYTFEDVDVDRYYVNGEYTQVFLSSREIDKAKIEDQWLIRHLKYTHGYGVTLSRVDKVTNSGQPDMLIHSIPPVSGIPEVSIARPEIYFGESKDDYVIVGTDEAEFDYPSGEANMYNFYEGDAGIKLNLLNRILFAIRERSVKILVSTNINKDSRIMIYRNVQKRVQTIAPFLAFDDDPYIVIADGRLFWIVDAYTMSAYYPYSEPWAKTTDMNYIRNSVKVIIDAYNGDTSFYISDPDDPMVLTLQKIYPSLFKDFDDMPEYMRAHIHYPNALLNIQANVFKKYHMTNVEVFYQNEDRWAIANETYGQSEVVTYPSYFIMKLPGEDQAEFINSITFTPNGKNNMTGLLVARNDVPNYGELILYRLPKDRIIYGPAHIEAQINQDPEISKEFALWNNSGSLYSRGNMFVIPVEDSIVYVEPIYLEATAASLPEVKRVAVYYNERLAYKPTLGEALDELFGPGAGAPLTAEFPVLAGKEAAAILEAGGEIDSGQTEPGTPGIPGTPGTELPGDAQAALSELIRLANEAYEKAQQAQRAGDWTEYGRYMEELQKYLTQMAQMEAN
ncbi:MAG: UPF0182 family protein [Anaerovoracaceae bacterium]|jgi:uncharacterized membrane protein (UPF0182 family)